MRALAMTRSSHCSRNAAWRTQCVWRVTWQPPRPWGATCCFSSPAMPAMPSRRGCSTTIPSKRRGRYSATAGPFSRRCISTLDPWRTVSQTKFGAFAAVVVFAHVLTCLCAGGRGARGSAAAEFGPSQRVCANVRAPWHRPALLCHGAALLAPAAQAPTGASGVFRAVLHQPVCWWLGIARRHARGKCRFGSGTHAPRAAFNAFAADSMTISTLGGGRGSVTMDALSNCIEGTMRSILRFASVAHCRAVAHTMACAVCKSRCISHSTFTCSHRPRSTSPLATT